MANIYIDSDTGDTYQEQTTTSETLDDGTVVTYSTWGLIESSQLEDKSAVKKKVGRPSKKK
jgi:hypothetical protein